MKVPCIFALVVSIGSVNGQTSRDLSIVYEEGRGKTVNDNDGQEMVTLKLNENGLCAFYEVDVIGDNRVVRYEYAYDENNRVREITDYSLSSGYRKKVIAYDSRGFRIDEKEYESGVKTAEGNWILVSQLKSDYDNMGRRTRFESIQYPGRSNPDFNHLVIDNTYASTSNNQCIFKETQYNRSGGVVSTNSGKRTGSIDKPFDDNILGEKMYGTNSYAVVSATEQFKNESYFVNERMTEDLFYGFKSGSGDVRNTVFSLRYLVKNSYKDGRLTAQIIHDANGPVVKREIRYSGNTPLEMVTYYTNSAGDWTYVGKEKFTVATQRFFPPLIGKDFTNESSVVAESPQSEVYPQESPVFGQASSVTADPMETNDFEYSDDLYNDLTLEESMSEINLLTTTINAETMDLMNRMLVVINSERNHIIEQQTLMQLAMKEFLENHREELQKMNEEFVQSQLSLFEK